MMKSWTHFVEDYEDFDPHLTAALHIQPVSHLQTETLVVMVRFEHVQRELGTFLDKEEAAEKETDRLLFDKTKLNWKYANKLKKSKSALAALCQLALFQGGRPLPSQKNASIGVGNGKWAMGNVFRSPLPIAHCPLPKNANSLINPRCVSVLSMRGY